MASMLRFCLVTATLVLAAQKAGASVDDQAATSATVEPAASSASSKIETIEVIVESKSYRESSAGKREDKKFQMVGQILGSGPTAAWAQGVQAGFFITPHDLLILEATRTDEYEAGTSVDYEDSSGTSTNLYNSKVLLDFHSVGVHYKRFEGNSFYWRAGVDYGEGSLDRRSSIADENYKFSGKLVSATFNIGNQWQWDNFTLGCDWIGISAPLYSEVTAARPTALASVDQRQYNEDKSNYFTDFNINLLRFYIGASW